MNSTSEMLWERARKVAPGGVHSPVRAFGAVGGVPRFIQSASGAELTDVEGKRYIDFCMSWGPLIFGHRDEEIEGAVREALSHGWSYGTAEPYSLELAEWIVEKIPWIEKIRFVNSGTEAVMSAIRLARGVTGRQKILKFNGCYHGHADSLLVRAGSGLADLGNPDSAGITKSTAADTLVAPLDDIPAAEKIFSRWGREIAAVILEPIPSNYGLLPQKEDFLAEICDLARKAGALIIFDEVITGFRISLGGMTERVRCRPDLVTYGKIIGGGFPVGAYGGRADLMDRISPTGPVYQAGTLSANPVAMRAGLATLKKLEREAPYAILEQRTKKLANALERVASQNSPFPFRVQTAGSIFWIVFGESKGPIRSPDQIPAIHRECFSPVFHSLLKQGIYLPPSPLEVGFLSTAHTDQHLERFIQAFLESVKEWNPSKPKA